MEYARTKDAQRYEFVRASYCDDSLSEMLKAILMVGLSKWRHLPGVSCTIMSWGAMSSNMEYKPYRARSAKNAPAVALPLCQPFPRKIEGLSDRTSRATPSNKVSSHSGYQAVKGNSS